MTLSVRPISPHDEQIWTQLFADYRASSGAADDPQIVANAWGWVLRGEHALMGIVAVDETDTPVALANLRWFARADEGDLALWVDGLYTRPEARGQGAARALLREAAAIAAEGDATVVRWMTADDNTTARRLYDRLATQTRWVTYAMESAPRTTTS